MENYRRGGGVFQVGGGEGARDRSLWGEALSLTVGAFFLTVKLPCLQSLKALIRRTFPL